MRQSAYSREDAEAIGVRYYFIDTIVPEFDNKAVGCNLMCPPTDVGEGHDRGSYPVEE